MLDRVVVSGSELSGFYPGNRLSDKMNALYFHQQESWTLCRDNYADLEKSEVKSFSFDQFEVKVQFNPARITSTTAKVDKESIRNRKCFLCAANLPPEQRGLIYGNDYLILVNPYPIFPRHYTIPKTGHIVQTISANFGDMLDLAKSAGEEFVLIYNGPRCGASAPDHMHFQAGNSGFMPIDEEFEDVINMSGEVLYAGKKTNIYATDQYLRKFIAIESADKNCVKRAFQVFYNGFVRLDKTSPEPMMNIYAVYKNDRWRVIIFPRGKHRPDFYFAEGEKQILLSPASVDLGGVLITPREEDFRRVDSDIIRDLFRQVTMSKEYFEYLRRSFLKFEDPE